MLDCPHQFQIGAIGEFDRYRTGTDFAILGPPLAVKLRGEMLVVRVRHRVWGIVGASLAALNVEIAMGLPTPSADCRPSALVGQNELIA